MKPFLLGLAFVAVLPACTLVEGDRILGRDMAAEHPAFVGIDPKLDLGPAPVAGARRSLQYFEMERIARETSVLLTSDAVREACFERATNHLSAEALSDVLKTPGLEILDFSHNPLPAGRAEFLANGLSPSGLWRGRWLFGDNRSMPIWARVRSVGSPATARPPTAGPEIGRGDTVRVEVTSGGVLLAFDAAAENSGHTGERVTVRNPDNGQRLRAVVEAPGKAGIRK